MKVVTGRGTFGDRVEEGAHQVRGLTGETPVAGSRKVVDVEVAGGAQLVATTEQLAAELRAIGERNLWDTDASGRRVALVDEVRVKNDANGGAPHVFRVIDLMEGR